MPLQNAFMLLLLGTIWGASYMFIKVSVAEITPLTFVVLRTGIAGVMLVLLLWFRKRALPKRNLWPPLIFMGLFNTLIPYGLINWGEVHISSALAAILTATMPLFTVILAHFWSDGERMDRFKAMGVLIGFVGVVLLLAPDMQAGVIQNILGAVAVVGAGLSYAIAAVFARRNLKGHDPIVLSTGMLLAGCAMSLPVAFFFESPFALAPSAQTWGATLALAAVGTAAAYLIYYWLIDKGGAVQASLVTYVIPVGGIFWGWLLLGESIHWTFIAGLAAILLGIMISNRFQIVRILSR
jgi:drug/metabolite transporter (DMT)-like permease